MRILLLEDNPMLAESIVRLLEAHGYEVVHVATVAAAKDAYEPDGFSVLLCDYELPDGTGLDFLGGIRGSDKATTILWSGIDRKRELDESGLTVDHLLTKSVTATTAMLDVIEAIVGEAG